MSRVALSLIVAAGVLAAPGLAAAQVCLKRPDLVRQLAEIHGETPTGIGLAANGGVLEIFASKAGETWTAAITRPDGLACVVMSGEGWQMRLPLSVARDA